MRVTLVSHVESISDAVISQFHWIRSLLLWNRSFDPVKSSIRLDSNRPWIDNEVPVAPNHKWRVQFLVLRSRTPLCVRNHRQLHCKAYPSLPANLFLNHNKTRIAYLVSVIDNAVFTVHIVSSVSSFLFREFIDSTHGSTGTDRSIRYSIGGRGEKIRNHL